MKGTITRVIKDKTDELNKINKSFITSLDKPTYTQKGIGLKFVLQGVENYSINGKWFTVTAGNFIAIKDNSELEICLKTKNITEGACVYVNPDVFSKINRLSVLNEINTEFDLIEGVFNFSKNEWLNNFVCSIPNQLRIVNSMNFEDLATCILREQFQISKECNQLPAKHFSTKLETYRKIKLAKDYLKSIHHRSVPLDELLSVAGVSKYHFSRQFKSLEGVSPSRFHLDHRLTLASNTLLENKLSIKDLSLMYGFSDIHHFSKAFKKKYNISPTHFVDQYLSA